MSLAPAVELKLPIVKTQECGLMGILIGILSCPGKLGLSANAVAVFREVGGIATRKDDNLSVNPTKLCRFNWGS
jgi:hypothetical protein